MAAPLLWLAALALAATPARAQGSTPTPALAAIALSIRSRAIQDSRCYLMNGGAVESFFISEDTPVGSIIGTLSVNGDPNELTGDISLRIQEKNPAVALAAGSKNLTLTRALDREEQLGPSSVYVNVRCDRRHTSDPSFIIPTSIRVYDVNDNAPSWRGAPYRARVSELSAAGARVLAATAADPDQGQHGTVRYSVLPGPGSEYVAFASELDSTIIIRRPLDYETLRTFTVRLRAQDGGSPPLHNDTTLTVEVLDADDQNPKFTYDHYTVVVGRDVEDGSILTPTPGPVHAADQDLGIAAPVRYSVNGEGTTRVRVNPDSGVLSATAGLLERDGFDYTVVLKATQVDNPDRYALATLALKRHARDATTSTPGGTSPGGTSGAGGTGGTGVRFTRRSFVARVAEDAAAGTVLMTLTTNAADKPLQYYVSERTFLQQFAINSAGDVHLRRSLPRDNVTEYKYQVMATDGNTNDTASIQITVQHVNEWEPRFKHAHYEFMLDASSANTHEHATRGRLVGTLHVHDGDDEDNVTLHLTGPDARLLSVSAAGDVFVSDPRALNASELHVVATAVDSGTPPRQTSVPVVVRITSKGGAPGAVSGAAAGAPVLLAAFSCALAVLAMLVAALLLHLCRLKRKRQVKDKSSVSPLPEKQPVAAGCGAGSGTGGSLQSVSAGASSILAASTTSLDRAPPHAATNVNTSTSTNTSSTSASSNINVANKGALSDHLHGGAGGGAGRSGVAWPSATIPARLKRLSWDDAQISEERRDVTEATNTTVAEHMNLTVYF